MTTTTGVWSQLKRRGQRFITCCSLGCQGSLARLSHRQKSSPPRAVRAVQPMPCRIFVNQIIPFGLSLCFSIQPTANFNPFANARPIRPRRKQVGHLETAYPPDKIE